MFIHKRLIISTIIFSTLFIFDSCNKTPVGLIDLNDGDYIMFIRNTNKNSEICVMRSDGTDLKVITSSNKDKHGINAVNYWGGRWSPDKTKIILRSFPNGFS